MSSTLRRSAARLAALACLALAPDLRAQSTPERAEPCALVGVRLSSEEGAPARTLLLADGRIRSVLDVDAELPAGTRRIDAEGLVATPALIDAFTAAGCETPEPVAEQDRPVSITANVRIDMRRANRKGIQPAFRAADVLDLAEASARHRKAGFGALLSAPRGELLAGRGVLATTRDAAARDVVLVGEALQHAAFAASGDGYPRTLMAFHAQLRQFFLDAQRHAELARRWEAGLPGERPAFDADLEAGAKLLAGSTRIACEADSARAIERWLRLADEFGFELAVVGGREAWKLADVLRERDVPVILTLDWGEEVDDPDAEEASKETAEEVVEEGTETPDSADGSDVPRTESDVEVALESEDVETAPSPAPARELPEVDGPGGDDVQGDETPDSAPPRDRGSDEGADADWLYEEPLAARRERRREWVEGRDCALRLREAGVRFAFGTGAEAPGELLDRVRTLVENGLPADAALAALTTTPAELLGVGRHLGSLEPGRLAAIALWTQPPLEEDAKLAWLVVDGIPYEFDVDVPAAGAPAEGVDFGGVWTLTFDDDGDTVRAELDLEMAEDGAVEGTYSLPHPGQPGATLDGRTAGSVSGTTLELHMTVDLGELAVDVTITGEWGDSPDAFSGEIEITSPHFETTDPFEAERNPEGGLR